MLKNNSAYGYQIQRGTNKMITRLPRCTAATAAARAYASEAKRRLSDPINVINLSGDSYSDRHTQTDQ